MDTKKVKLNFDGKGEVKVFITEVELEAAIKGYTEEKLAQFLASKLSGPAFEVYLRLTDDQKKVFESIKEELLKEFERGQLDREEAIATLNDRRRKSEESPQTYAYKIVELVKLAYPTFNVATRKTIAKDYYMRGLHSEMQVALKASERFNDNDINALATETVRLELAGIKSIGTQSPARNECNQVGDVTEFPINSIVDKVVEKLQ